MSEEVSIHQAPRLAPRRLRPRTWIGLGIAGIMLLVGVGAVSILGPLLFSAGPDTLQFVSVTPAQSKGGRFSIQFRFLRTDGKPIGTSISTISDLIDVKTGQQLLGRQCGFRVNQSVDPRSMDVTLTDLHPANQTKPRRVKAKLDVRMMPAKEMLEFGIWEFSGRKFPQPTAHQGGWRTFTHELDLPPAAPTSATGPE